MRIVERSKLGTQVDQGDGFSPSQALSAPRQVGETMIEKLHRARHRPVSKGVLIEPPMAVPDAKIFA
jgi:hypothetical protein